MSRDPGAFTRAGVQAAPRCVGGQDHATLAVLARSPVAVRTMAYIQSSDLQHAGNHLVAAAGASTRDLMHRMGHGSVRAALIYRHATDERDQEIARELSRRAQAARETAEQEAKNEAGDEDYNGPDDGSAGALVPVA